MSTIETDRWILHSRIREVLGNREGDILMEHLPPAGWSHLATKDDVTMAKLELRAEMAEIKAELKADIAEVRIAMEKGFRAQTWKMVAAIGTSQAISVAIMAAMVNSLR
ncbi:MAG: hypothetical protein F2612_02485 [Actinobacteria bacterium]|nr:hypothetical protein [Ilumatobacteraceae bacterium]MSZ18517.1 hypothetical protein [Actinomycetota bacterium]MSZ31045.1 hypothetical protein [Actinomycetota bacterium]